jgi:P4 family phage/plasmid primase-like protien
MPSSKNDHCHKRSDALARLYAVFGDVVFLVVKKGTKRPQESAWQKISFADTQKADYQEELERCVREGGNIGVVLGPASDGLYSIDLDDDALVPDFLLLNTNLEKTTRTKGKRGNQFYFRLVPGSSYPNSQATYALRDTNGKKCGEWRCGGGGFGAQSIVFGVHPDGMNYQIEVDTPPAILEFKSLQWFYPFGQTPQKGPAPKATRQQSAERVRQQTTAAATGNAPPNPQNIYADLFASFGTPFIKTKGGMVVNQPFFARLWAKKRLAFYDYTAEDFYAYNPENGLYERLRMEKVLSLISGDVLAEGYARKFPGVAAKVNSGLLHSVANLIKCDSESSEDDFFKSDPLALPVIHAANGMVCILDNEGTLELKPFDPDFRSRNLIPIAYTPEAKCITFREQLLAPVLVVNDDIDVLQRYCGLVLLGGNRAQKILIMKGEGGTGKGTIVRLVTQIIGRDNVAQLRVEKLNGRFETARLVGKLLLNVVEATADYLNQNGAEVVKALVGHDPMEGEKKGLQEPVSFEGEFAVIVTTNEEPNVRMAGDESAWRRRLVIIEFPTARAAKAQVIEKFEEQIMQEESEGVFAWMIQGAVNHWKELKEGKGFTTTDSQKERVEGLIGRSKSAETFILTNVDSDPGGQGVTSEELYDAYSAYCVAQNWVPFPEHRFLEIAQYQFMKHLGIGKSHDIKRVDANDKTRNRRGYRGVKLK